MNQIKIGEFIAKLRKEKKMTQQELADKLSVTDRAVSNWENGRRMPDVSFFKPLCEILGISVNELVVGEKISKNKIASISNETIINTLNVNAKNKKESKNIIKALFAILLILVVLIILIIKNLHPKIDIYNLQMFRKDEKNLTKASTYKLNNKTYDIYYYGINEALLCNLKNDCFDLKTSLKYNQTNIENVKKYLKSQTVNGNNNEFMLWDGGTTIYENPGYSIVFCNTVDGNRDVYFGVSEMLGDLDGEYCGHEKNPSKKFIRTYHIISVTQDENDEVFMNVTLSNFKEEKATVKINNSYILGVGRDYEFSFWAFDEFEDNIKNIFKYSTLLDAVETDKLGKEQINEKIYVNKVVDNGAELNEVENVSMVIKEGTLTKTSATVVITDLSGKRYIYGSWFRIDKKENGVWKEAEKTGKPYAFTDMAYGIDKANHLEFNCNWSYMYKSLEKGEYRLVKDVLPNKTEPVVSGDEKFFSVEFEIE